MGAVRKGLLNTFIDNVPTDFTYTYVLYIVAGAVGQVVISIKKYPWDKLEDDDDETKADSEDGLKRHML